MVLIGTLAENPSYFSRRYPHRPPQALDSPHDQLFAIFVRENAREAARLFSLR